MSGREVYEYADDDTVDARPPLPSAVCSVPPVPPDSYTDNDDEWNAYANRNLDLDDTDAGDLPRRQPSHVQARHSPLSDAPETRDRSPSRSRSPDRKYPDDADETWCNDDDDVDEKEETLRTQAPPVHRTAGRYHRNQLFRVDGRRQFVLPDVWHPLRSDRT
jgi:hypothetical protein